MEYTLWWTNIAMENCHLYPFILDFPIQNGDFPWQNVSSPDGIFLSSARAAASAVPVAAQAQRPEFQ